MLKGQTLVCVRHKCSCYKFMFSCVLDTNYLIQLIHTYNFKSDIRKFRFQHRRSLLCRKTQGFRCCWWCRNGIQQRLNSWQDGVSGTNCPIQPGKNWTYEFQVKDQIGTFTYFPSINLLKAGGGFGPIRVNNRPVIEMPFPKPEAEFDLLIGDWYLKSYKVISIFLCILNLSIFIYILIMIFQIYVKIN